MFSNADLLDQAFTAAAMTAAAIVTDPQAYALAAHEDRPGHLRQSILARMMPGFRPIDTCPEGGWVWVRGGPHNEPKLRTARGEQWRRDRREGRPAPTYWAPCSPPMWDEAG